MFLNKPYDVSGNTLRTSIMKFNFPALSIFHPSFQTQFGSDLRNSFFRLKTLSTRLTPFPIGDWEQENACTKYVERETVTLPPVP